MKEAKIAVIVGAALLCGAAWLKAPDGVCVGIFIMTLAYVGLVLLREWFINQQQVKDLRHELEAMNAETRAQVFDRADRGAVLHLQTMVTGMDSRLSKLENMLNLLKAAKKAP